MAAILVPLDGSALAERVLPYVRSLVTIQSGSIRLLRVVSAADTQALLAHEDVLLAHKRGPELALHTRELRAWKQLISQAERYLAARAAELCPAGLAVTSEVRIGHPAETIVQVAAERGSDLIALATHGYSGVTRWMLGSVADKVVQAADIPVLLVREAAPAEYRLRRILVPLDGSPLAAQALPHAIGLAKHAQAEIVLLQVVAPTIDAFPRIPLPPGVRDLLHEQVLRELRDLATASLQHGVAVTPLVLDGAPAQVIIETAEEQHADLIVMARHGFSGIRRWAVGSVADKVAHAATTPLLLVRAQPGEWP